jgi:GAF domain-containing protein
VLLLEDVNFMNYNNLEERLLCVLNNKKNVSLDDIIFFLYKNFKKYNWIGIYIVQDKKLLLGPWRGKYETEHIKIPIGTGVCGSAAESGKIENVPDVRKDDRFIACFLTTRSELVVPIKDKGKVIGEIDIDSDVENAFNKKDEKFLEKLSFNKVFIKLVKNYDV